MYLINIEGLRDEEILNNIGQSIEHFRQQDRVFSIYEIDGLNIGFKPSKIPVSAFKVNLNRIENYSVSDIEEFVIYLKELNSNIFLMPNNKNIVKTFKDMSADNGLAYMLYEPFDFDRELKVENFTYNEYQIIKEIFEEPLDAGGFTSVDFMFKLKINEGGIVYNSNGKQLLDLKKDEFADIFLMKPEDSMWEKELEICRKNKSFTVKFYNPLAFLFGFETVNINKKIIDYKYRVFDSIKNISPQDYPKVPNPIIDILNRNEYIKLEDSLNIIRGHYK